LIVESGITFLPHEFVSPMVLGTYVALQSLWSNLPLLNEAFAKLLVSFYGTNTNMDLDEARKLKFLINV